MRAVLIALFVLAAASAPSAAAAPQDNADALYQEARRLFEALDYEKAVVALDQAIAALQTGAPGDAARRERLAMAFEMRARSRFGLGDQDGAKADFVLLLKLAPSHALAGQVSPRVVALFEQTARETITNLTVSLTPATATLAVDGTPVPATGTIRVAVGDHIISAEQAGYRPARETVTAVAEATAQVTLTLERVSSVIRIITTPADVEVKVDGAVVGRTSAAADAAGAGAAPVASAALVVADVATGSHTVELTRGCFVSVTQRLEVVRPDDYAVGPVTLQPAVATLSVTADQAGAQVFVDGRERGVAPVKVADVCEGEHLVELRTPFGADARRVDLRAGVDLVVEGVLKPTFAIVSASGAPANSTQDYRVIVQRAFAASRSVTLLAPSAELADKALKANQLPVDWLATDAAGRPVGASAQIAGPSRKEASSRLADAFKTQGVATVTAIDGSRVILSLLSAGSVAPDAIEVALDSQPSIAAAVARLDRRVGLYGGSIGLQVIDVADVAGPLIIGVDPKGPAAEAARVADVVVQADGKPVSDAAALAAVVAGRRPGDSVALDLRDPAGVPKRVDLKVGSSPKVIGLFEHGLLANRILLDLRARLSDAKDPMEQSVIRLNIAVALARLGDWSTAREELQRVKLPDRHGVGEGTVQYLLGLAAENLGNRAEAETAFKAAALSDGLLTEDGPSIKELAEAKLVELQKIAR
ncbi:MAG: PEGA domain-containing protein [Vicinamibacterales bacterium]